MYLLYYLISEITDNVIFWCQRERERESDTRWLFIDSFFLSERVTPSLINDKVHCALFGHFSWWGPKLPPTKVIILIKHNNFFICHSLYILPLFLMHLNTFLSFTLFFCMYCLIIPLFQIQRQHQWNKCILKFPGHCNQFTIANVGWIERQKMFWSHKWKLLFYSNRIMTKIAQPTKLNNKVKFKVWQDSR